MPGYDVAFLTTPVPIQASFTTGQTIPTDRLIKRDEAVAIFRSITLCVIRQLENEHDLPKTYIRIRKECSVSAKFPGNIQPADYLAANIDRVFSVRESTPSNVEWVYRR